MPISNYIRSWLLLVPMIPSIAVIIFDLYHFIGNRTLRTAINNHVIILLLFCALVEQITDLAWQSHYYRTGTALISTPVFCYCWVFMSAWMYISSFFLMAWASIERHMLIFHAHCFSTKYKRFFFHYLPLSSCILWPLLFYLLTIFIIPCNTSIRYNRRFCSLYNCVIAPYWSSMVDSIGNYVVPSFITVIFSVALFVRVVRSRYNVRRRLEWRNYKKMALQLLPLSTLYLLLQFPPMTLYAAYSAGLPWSVAADYYSDTLFFSIWTIQLTPLACTLSLPDLKMKCQDCLFFWRRRNPVGPQLPSQTQPTARRGGVSALTA